MTQRLATRRSIPWLATAVALVSPSALQACTPIPPLTLIYSGPSTLLAIRYGAPALVTVIAIKCGLFAWSARSWAVSRSLPAMFVANLYSTIPGMLMAFALAVPMLGAFPLLIVAVLCWTCCASLQRAGARTLGLARASWFGVLVLSAVASVFLLGLSQGMLVNFLTMSDTLYWLTKWASVTCAIVLGLMVSAAFELRIILADVKNVDETEELARAVLLANLGALFVVALIGAAVALPERLRSPHGLLRE